MTDAVLLFSGGIDSTGLIAWAQDAGISFRVIEYDYPGRPAGERKAAAAILRHYQIQDPIRIDIPTTDTTPLPRDDGRIQAFVPLRNLWFHTTAALIARQMAATRILAAHLDQDALDFPDAAPNYFTKIQDLIDQAALPDDPALKLELPFQGLSKLEIVRRARALNAPLDATWSCYRDQDKACGDCTGCREARVVLSS